MEIHICQTCRFGFERENVVQDLNGNWYCLQCGLEFALGVKK